MKKSCIYILEKFNSCWIHSLLLQYDVYTRLNLDLEYTMVWGDLLNWIVIYSNLLHCFGRNCYPIILILIDHMSFIYRLRICAHVPTSNRSTLGKSKIIVHPVYNLSAGLYLRSQSAYQQLSRMLKTEDDDSIKWYDLRTI